MTAEFQLLEQIEQGIVAHGNDLGGWTKLEETGLKVFDGRITLRAEIYPNEDPASPSVHAHVFATLHEHEDEVLDACLVGIGDTQEAGISEAAMIWITCVAGPIRSFLDNRPVCMTCQAGVANGDIEKGFAPGDYGLTGMRAYVGPSIARGFSDDGPMAAMDDKIPWFRYAAASAAPRRVHLAKATIMTREGGGWQRDLEIDGHEVTHNDPEFPAGIRVNSFGYLTRFAVFEFPRNSKAIVRRKELERTILHFALNYNRFNDYESLRSDMTRQGFHPQLIHEVESFSTIAFGRALFEHLGVQYSPTVIRARSNGRVEQNVPLMGIPAFSRAKALFGQIREKLPEDQLQNLCCYNAESNALLQVLESTDDPDWQEITLYPSVVPDFQVNNQTMDQAVAILQSMVDGDQTEPKKPWWKFW